MRVKEALYPCVIVDGEKLFQVLLLSRKAMTKTIESGVLWKPDPNTNKVLKNEPEIAVSSIVDRGAWIEARVRSQGASPRSKNAGQRKSSRALAASTPSMAGKAGKASQRAEGGVEEKGAKSGSGYAVLGDLYRLLQSRKKEMPEGSYTSYLFAEGIEKIQKKLGEEAVEVILARGKTNICQEAADLLYHLWVYLVQKKINPEIIMQVLMQRAQEGHANE